MYQTTISILDFVTICLGATLLLVVMVPNQTRSSAVVASHQEALELVRQFFSLDTLNHNVHLSEDLIARHPSLPALSSRAPFEYLGKRLSALDESQRVRRAEVLVEMPLGQIERLDETIATLRERGIGYVNFRTFSTAGTAPASDSRFSTVLSASDNGSSVFGALSPFLPSAATDALESSELFRHQSPTPAEPVVIIVNSTEGLQAIANALPNTVCPSTEVPAQATLFLVGPPADATNTAAIGAALRACARSDYMVIP